ncbi:MAG TPA: phosphotransferase, partial [Phototrophicaceae bacterium]|nr:phosphotransferase [Phototrophicaceae bacterium]
MGSPELTRLLSRLPNTLRTRLKEADFEPINEGLSGTSIFHVTSSGQSDSYLKVAERGSEQDLQPEVARLLWLQTQLPVPKIRYFAESGDTQYLLLSA